MQPNAFISHTEEGGTGLAKIIEYQLLLSTLNVKSFLSSHAIKHGGHIVEEVLKALVNTDVLFVILEPRVPDSRWIEWEYNFCKDRNIKIIPILFPRFDENFYRIPWFDPNIKYLKYDYNEYNFKNDIWYEVHDMKSELDQLARKRESIELEACADKTSYFEQDLVRISGNITNSLLGTVNIHVPCSENNHPPIHSSKIKSIVPDDNGHFEFKFTLPTVHGSVRYTQRRFIELQFDKKSKLIPISVHNKNDTNTKQRNDDSSGEEKSSDGTMDLETKRKIDAISSGTLQSIPRTINDRIITRDNEISELMQMLGKNDRIVITGEKGSGKSALMCQLYERVSERHTTLFIRCDDHIDTESFEQLNNSIIQEHSFVDLLQNIATESNKLTVIFDSLDSISRNEKSMSIFKHLLKNMWGTNRVRTILSVRSYDYEYSPSIRKTDWGEEYLLTPLTVSDLDSTLAGLGNPSIPDELKHTLRNPLCLKLLSLILKHSPDADFTNIKNEIELYDKHWGEYVDRMERADDVRSTLYRIVQKMYSTQSITVPYDDLGSHDVMHEILSRNIVLRDKNHDRIGFFHHAYLDYVISRFILARHSEFVRFLLDDEYNIFLRPTIVFALSVLYTRDPDQFVAVINKILRSELKYFWKISALTALAGVKESTRRNFNVLGDLLTNEAILQRHFLMESTKQRNPLWFDLWKGSFLSDWASSKHNSNSIFIVEYLKSIMTQDNGYHAFKIIKAIVDNSSIPPAKRKAIELSSRINMEAKIEWLLTLSVNEDTYIRNGVADTLAELIKTNPESVPRIFCNLFTYVEPSDDQTQLATYGTSGITSTKRQDNSMIIWRIGELFPKLLKENPTQMINSAIEVFTTLRKQELDQCKDGIVEDHGHIWLGYSSGYSRDEIKLLTCIKEHLKRCPNKELNKLKPIFNSTRLATFHSILLDELVKRKDDFTKEIFNTISDPAVYEIPTMRSSIEKAIKEINPLLTSDQVKVLLNNVMNIWSGRQLSQDKKNTLTRIKAGLLSNFPDNSIGTDHRKILDSRAENDMECDLPCQNNVIIGKESTDAVQAKPDLETTIANSLGKELEYKEKIELLEAISEYLDRETADLDNAKTQSIKELLISCKDDPSPEDDADDDQHIMYYDTVRGLTAKCLVKLLFHSKDPTLVPLVKELSDDPVNIVRGDMCSMLDYLFDHDHELAYLIAKKYSTDDSTRVQYYLPTVLQRLANVNPKQATLIINNILDTQAKSGRIHQVEYLAYLVIYLAFHKEDQSAIYLLDRIVKERVFSPEIRSKIPFALKDHYLFVDEFQAKSLDLLYALLDDPNWQVRDMAAFFTLYSFSKHESVDGKEFVKKIGRHLDRIASEVDRDSWCPRIIENLVRFLIDFWHLLPEKTIDYLEKMTDQKVKEYSASQPVFAENSVTIIAGLLQHTPLSEENRRRCLDVLDIYAMAGWYEALQLLGAMEHHD